MILIILIDLFSDTSRITGCRWIPTDQGCTVLCMYSITCTGYTRTY